MPSCRLTVAVLAALPLCLSFAHAADLVPKQLAGAPEEFAAMAAPDPVDATIHSKAALVPVELTADKAGGRSWQGTVPVQNGRARVLVFGGAHDAWRVEMAPPGQQKMQSAAKLARRSDAAEFGLEQDLHAADYYALDGVASGEWKVKLHAEGGASNRGFLLIEGDERTELASHQTHKRQLLGERIGFVAQLTAVGADEVVTLGKQAGRITSATLRVTGPDGGIETLPMYDDGRHGDGRANDGLYGGDFLAKASGQHLAQVMVAGTDRSGQPLLRSAEHIVPVVDAALELRATRASAAKSAGNRLTIELPVAADRSGQHYRAYAEVWGRDAAGAPLPIAWVGGMATPQAGKLALGFDQRWVQRAGARAPFELRNVRIEDPDHFITLAGAPRLALSLPASAQKAAGGKITIDDEMRMGPRPAAPATQAKGVGRRLLLVHGYCSGGVWPAAQFSTASTFLDANQNRSHDQFARLIQSFGATWNSFGVVAHSQGGAAALHLYNYYWSGLDYATGNRLIQSVGTPYKGTNLAGILAALGSWFGVGCGTNDNLSYSGASSWLAGISSSSRAKVNYYTTAFRTTNWWTNDYCNFATDLVLSDPEDGTTEQVNGQLPYAVNRGHTSGQCHTSGMRDPAQYHDSTRNATMNLNAAR